MGFAEDAADMDATAYKFLGEDCQVDLADGNGFVPLLAFVEPTNPLTGYDDIDAAKPSRRIKVPKSVIGLPSSAMRFKVPLLGTQTFSMTNYEAATIGRDWIIELQNAST